MFGSLFKFTPRLGNSGALILSRFASSSSSTTSTFSNSLLFSRPSIISNIRSPIIQQLNMNKLVNFQSIQQPTSLNLDVVVAEEGDEDSHTLHALSVLRKRRLKMKKHKYKKRRKAQRALRKRLGK